MVSILKKIFTLDISLKGSEPLKYRESQYTLAELERRLTAEVNGNINFDKVMEDFSFMTSVYAPNFIDSTLSPIIIAN